MKKVLVSAYHKSDLVAMLEVTSQEELNLFLHCLRTKLATLIAGADSRLGEFVFTVWNENAAVMRGYLVDDANGLRCCVEEFSKL